jgi:SAM-dependent methyltransferase
MRSPTPFYARAGLNVECYDPRAAVDVGRSSVRGDAAWYRRLARRTGGPVLEGACGTGRVAWEIAKAGIEVVGFDLSPPMLRAAEAKRASMPPRARGKATFVRGDLRTFDLGRRRFPLAIVPFRSFQCLLTPEDQRACLLRFRRHLRPGGRLVLDLFDPVYRYLSPTEPRVFARRPAVRHPARGTLVSVETRRIGIDPVRQVMDLLWTFREKGPRGRTVRVEREILRMRWSFRHEMRHLFGLTGFAVEAEHSDFRGGAPAYGREQVWVLRRR